MSRRRITLLGCAALLFAATACSANSSPTAQATTSSATTASWNGDDADTSFKTKTPSFEPSDDSSHQAVVSSSAGPKPVVTRSWTTPDGYSFRLEINEPLQIVVTDQDVADQKPGQAELTVEESATGLLTNTTAGHNAPMDESADIPEPMAGWTSKSPMCGSDIASEGYTFGNINVLHLPATEQQATFDGTAIGCVVTPLSWQADTTDLAPNTTTALTASFTLKFIVPENSLEQFKTVVHTPDFWLLMQNNSFNGCISEGNSDSGVVALLTIKGKSGCPSVG